MDTTLSVPDVNVNGSSNHIAIIPLIILLILEPLRQTSAGINQNYEVLALIQVVLYEVL